MFDDFEHPTVDVRGLVIDREGRPVPGADVRLQVDPYAPAPPVVRTISSRDGSFAAQVAWPPGLKICLSALAYAPTFGTAIFEHYGPPDRLPQPMVLRLLPAGSCECTVVDPAGRPVAGAEAALTGLYIFDEYDWCEIDPPLASGSTDAAGRCRFDGLPAGYEAFVHVHHPDWAEDRARTEIEANQTVSKRIELEPGFAVQGRVVDEHGRPAPDVLLGLFGGNSERRPPHCRTDASGHYVLRSPYSGAYLVAVGVDERGRTALCRTVVLSDEEPVARFDDLRLRSAPVLRGQVLDEATGQPVPGARLHPAWRCPNPCSGGDADELPAYLADADGWFEFAVPAAALRLRARAQGYLDVSHGLDLRDDDLAEKTLRLRPDPGRQVVIRGRVVDETGRPVAGALIQLRNEPWGNYVDANAEVSADTDGCFQVATSESLRATAFEQPIISGPACRTRHGWENADSGAGRITVALQTVDAREISGRVVDELGRPVSSALVLMTEPAEGGEQPYMGERDWPAWTDADGRFHFPRAQSKSALRFELEADGYDACAWNHIPAGDSVGDAVFPLRWTDGRVRVRLLHDDGTPADGAIVHVLRRGPPAAVRTDAAGLCLLTDLPAGGHEVEALFAWDGAGRAGVVVPYEGIAEVEVRLSACPAPNWGESGRAESAMARDYLRRAWGLGVLEDTRQWWSFDEYGAYGNGRGVLPHVVFLDPRMAWDMVEVLTDPAERDLALQGVFDALALQRPSEAWAARLRLAEIGQPAFRVQAVARVGLALADMRPADARELLGQIRDVPLDPDTDPEAWIAEGDRVLLAERLGEPDAGTWREALLARPIAEHCKVRTRMRVARREMEQRLLGQRRKGAPIVAPAEDAAREYSEPTRRGIALATAAARIEDPERAVALLHEAKDLGCPVSRLVRALGDRDPELSAAWTAEALHRWMSAKETYDIARVCPNAARVRIEREVGRGQPGWPDPGDVMPWALALLPVDPVRAVETIVAMGWEVPSRIILCAAARWLMLTPAERRAASLHALACETGYYPRIY